MTPPPEYLNDDARACWYRVQLRLLARGEWSEVYEAGLATLDTQCARYLSFARTIRALQDVEPAELARMEATLADTHRLAREGLAQYLMIPHDRVTFAVMNA
jgi:phage terminase small subunit